MSHPPAILLWQQNVYWKDTRLANRTRGARSFKTHSCKRLALRKKADGVFSWRRSQQLSKFQFWPAKDTRRRAHRVGTRKEQ